MNIEKCANGSIIIEPRLFEDDRGYFFESFNEEQFNKETGMDFHPVQDNESKSCFGVMRGLHFQNPPYAQAKLVRVVKGAVYDVAVDIRKGSPTYGKYAGVLLTEDNHKQFFIPRGFAHGFIALEDDTVFQYKCDNYYNKESEGAINILDGNLNGMFDKIFEEYHIRIDDVTLSEKDMNNNSFKKLDSKFIYEN